LVGGELDEDEWEDEEEEDEDDFSLAPVEESLLSSPTSFPTAEDIATEEPKPAAEGSPAECPKCGALMNDGMLCDACGYNLQLKRVIHTQLETFEANPDVGFKRWFNSQLAEGESIGSIWKWILIGFGLLFVVVTVLLLPWSLIFAVPVIVVACVLFVAIKRSGKTGDEAFFDAGTSGTLLLFRTTGWRKLEWPFPKVPFYSAKGSDFGDDDLAEMSNASEIEALDLDGCAVTDAGLIHLANWTQLRYLVLTNTSVSKDAVLELQNKLTKTMVWM